MARTDSSPPSSEETVTRSAGIGAHDGAFTLLISCTDGVRALPLPELPEIVIGRTSDADVVVADGSVSRRHAILRIFDSMTIEDLGSMNGTRVNGARVKPRERVPVSAGTVIEVGNATLVVQQNGHERGTDSKKRNAQLGTMPVASAASASVLVDPTMKRIDALIDVIAPSPLHVLLLGETGVGKEVLAESLHLRSMRVRGPFLRLNCAALPDSVLEGELFGYERGAFTGATQARAGLFESADGGTVFLDEVGELPMTTQAKLLRVLENGEVLRLGSRKPTKVDVRFLSATNRDLRYLIASGTFRADLFFRLNGVSISIPALRDRVTDIPILAQIFLDGMSERLGKRRLSLSAEALAALVAYAWPGNVRELKNVLERSVVFAQDSEIALKNLHDAAPELLERQAHVSMPPFSVERTPTMPNLEALRPPTTSTRLRDHVTSAERERIEAALVQAHGNQKRAAEILGVSRRTLINKLDAHGVARPRKGQPGNDE